MHTSIRKLGFWLTLAAAMPAAAHDSWLSPRDKGGLGALELATGNRYPVQEFNPTAANLLRAECADGAGRRLALRAGREHANRMELQADLPGRAPPPLACWLELRELEIEIEPAIVQLYLDEIRAPASLRQAWSAMRDRGLPWREAYRKYARIETGTAQADARQRTQARQPVGLGLEIVLLGDAAVVPGQALEFQVLRDGQPLAGLAVELIGERSKFGFWRESDAQGRLRASLPFGGRWLLRATELRLSQTVANRWDSRFVTLAIEAP
jgi:hypothetical protein